VLVPSPTRLKGLSVIANILWFFLAGWWLALAHLLTGILLCITIIGIPLGVADFKMAGAALVPFGKEIVRTTDLAQPPAGAISVSGGQLRSNSRVTLRLASSGLPNLEGGSRGHAERIRA
jgi:hypothetical protein